MFLARSHFEVMSKRFISETLILVIFPCLMCSMAIAAENPQAVIQTGTDQILNILRQYPQDIRTRRERIQAIAEGYFDFEAMARLAVGPQWRSVPEEKRQEFTQDFEKLLFNSYVGEIEKYAKERATYRNRLIHDGYVVVEATVNDQSGPVSLHYYLHLKDGDWKVYDVVVQGMSLIANYRSQFDSVLTNGSFDHLTRFLRNKIAQMCGANRC